jgi:hypothetical protein
MDNFVGGLERSGAPCGPQSKWYGGDTALSQHTTTMPHGQRVPYAALLLRFLGTILDPKKTFDVAFEQE